MESTVYSKVSTTEKEVYKCDFLNLRTGPSTKYRVLTKLKPEIEEMEKYIREDIANENLRDEDIFRINEKIKDLEKQIANVVEG